MATTTTTKASHYYEGVGRRKAATARVRVTLSRKKEHSILVNDKSLQEYFDLSDHQNNIIKPLSVLGIENFDITVKVAGGGVTGQADAIQLGLARALVKYDESLKKQLKDNNYLTRDPRGKERKKPGLKKARKSPQWAKR
ncbi:30S ribosomal protein S9 [bacterium]|nr:30S ribosomal protein S9 [Candidatus Elulimicrobium humile]